MYTVGDDLPTPSQPPSSMLFLLHSFFPPAYLYRHHLPSPVCPHQVMHVQSVARVPVCASCGLTSESAVPTHHRRSTHTSSMSTDLLPPRSYQLVSTCTCMSCSADSSGNVQHPGGELILTDYIPHGPHLLKTTFFSLSYARRPSRCCLTMRDRCFFTHSLPAKGTLPTHIEPAPLHAPRVIASCPVYLAPTPPNAHHRCPVASRVLFPSNR